MAGLSLRGSWVVRQHPNQRHRLLNDLRACMYIFEPLCIPFTLCGLDNIHNK